MMHSLMFGRRYFVGTRIPLKTVQRSIHCSVSSWSPLTDRHSQNISSTSIQRWLQDRHNFVVSDSSSRNSFEQICRSYGNHTFYEESKTVLPAPTQLFTNNHLLVVNKPAGWRSVPNLRKENDNNTRNDRISTSTDGDDDGKCLLTHLQGEKLGGGSTQSFLLPCHRLDQPCTGVLLFAKTSRMASRVQRNWQSVNKTYLCVVPRSQLEELYRSSSSVLTGAASAGERHTISGGVGKTKHKKRDGTSSSEWRELKGVYQPPSLSDRDNSNTAGTGIITDHSSRYGNPERTGGWSVTITPFLQSDQTELDKDTNSKNKKSNRICSLRFKVLSENDYLDDRLDEDVSLLLVKTSDGARHVIRALLAMVGHCPIIGDVRYSNGRAEPLPDRSVALHARSLQLPSNKIHPQQSRSNQVKGKGVNSSSASSPSDEESISLPDYEFVAPIPETWKHFFGISEEDVSTLS